MTNQLQAASGAPAAAAGDWLTATNLVLIALGVVLALLVIWWGAKLKRRRKAVDETLTAHAEEAHVEAERSPPPIAASLDEMPPPAPETQPVPVAPTPPPLADAPVVAAAPVGPEPGADELTRLKGVGPKLAARLAELGITRFDQIAALSDNEAATLDAQLGSFQGRMARDRWVEQAGYLARDDRAGFEAAFGRL